MKSQANRIIFLVHVAFVAAISAPAQVFSEYQSARLLRPGESELGLHYSPVWLGRNFDYTRTINDLGLQLGTSVADGLELRIRYDRLWFREEPIGEGFSYMMFTPKFRIVKDRLALLLPIYFSLEKHIERTWVFSPGLIYGIPIGQQAEINLANSYLITLNAENSNLVSFNLGIALRPVGSWMFRPETGILIHPGQPGKFWSLGVGVSKRLGGNPSLP
ncbi:hypothetical protein [Lunatimonas salinarum]|uniref:hypothetical protein n=1 Tax=Lunatimonas salinarum TaxID=1774590 RepID=UPI001AE09744|nr:hypothetical protein [Lunatimonas salinarum]